MIRKEFWLMFAAVLSMSLAACSNGSHEVPPDPTPADSLNNENVFGTTPVEFCTSVINNSPYDEITDQNIEYMFLVGTGTHEFVNVQRWEGVTCHYEKNYSTYVLGDPEPYVFIWPEMGLFHEYRRNKDDRDVWEARDKYNRCYYWDQHVWKYFPNNTRYYAYSSNSPYCYMGSVGKKYPTFNIDLQNCELEYTNPGGEVYLQSEKLRDLVVGFSDEQKYDNTQPQKKADKVKITFTHILARLELAALVEDDEAIDVTVGYAAIGGLHTRAEYQPVSKYPASTYFQKDWIMHEPPRGYYTWIEMKLDNPVHLNTTAQPLQAKGAEPWVFPETLKGWTNEAMGDGAGIMLGVWMKNKYDGSYIIGSDKGYEKVYMPLEPMTLESENNYVLEVNFGCQYDVNGNPKGYHISYQPQIQKWATSQKEVDMVKK